MKKMLLAAAIAAAGTVAEAVDLTPADYVQDGLVVQFDAIDNAGAAARGRGDESGALAREAFG